jgi:hypothetical protein
MKLALGVGAATAFLALSGTASTGAQRSKGCTVAQSRALIQRFVTAFNRGDARTLDRIWDSNDWFKWYSVGNEPGMRIQGDSMRRDTLLPYFAARHAAHELLTPTRVAISRYPSGYRSFQYRLLRSADDLPGSPVVYSGKGALSCVTGHLDVWSMGEGP